MQGPFENEVVSGVFGVLAVILTVVGGWWKVRLIGRQDLRRDHGQTLDGDAHATTIQSLQAVIEGHGKEIARLSATVERLSEALDTERKMRWAAENRVATLERQLGICSSKQGM